MMILDFNGLFIIIHQTTSLPDEEIIKINTLCYPRKINRNYIHIYITFLTLSLCLSLSLSLNIDWAGYITKTMEGFTFRLMLGAYMYDH